MTTVDAADDLPEAPDDYAIVGAFLDGERVNAQQLRRALDDPHARDYLVELLTLRQVIGAHASYATAALAPAAPTRTHGWWPAVAAVLAIATAAGGYAIGERRPAPTSVSDGAPSRIEIVSAGQPSRAPQPTQIIQLI